MKDRNFQALCLKLAVPAIAIALALPAHATTVTYSTTGIFNCVSCTGSGSSSVAYTGSGETLTISFAGINPAQTLNVFGHSNASAGTITVAVNGGNSVSIAQPTTFKLTINQTVPTVNNGSLTGDLTGSISHNSSNGELSFSSTSLTLGNETYALTSAVDDLVPPVTNNGETSLQLKLTVTNGNGGGGSNPAPEPSFIGLTAAGFIGMFALVARRRRRTNE